MSWLTLLEHQLDNHVKKPFLVCGHGRKSTSEFQGSHAVLGEVGRGSTGIAGVIHSGDEVDGAGCGFV